MGIRYSAQIPTDGLVLALDAGSERSYPGSGNVWFDLSGKKNHCNWNNTPAFTNGYFVFNGTSNYGTVTNNSTLDFSNEQTVIIWMYHTYTSGRKNPWDQAYGGYGTWTHEQGDNINCYYGDAGSNASPYTSINTGTTARNQWNCVAMVRNTSNVACYQNGSLTAGPSAHGYGTLTATSANIRIGFGYAGYWQGNMAAVFAYTRALSSDEILEHYNITRERLS